MKIKCACKKVFYCDERCRKKDEHYHLPNCDALDDIDLNTVDFTPEPGARHGLVGLQNLGNTCYMNSAL